MPYAPHTRRAGLISPIELSRQDCLLALRSSTRVVRCLLPIVPTEPGMRACSSLLPVMCSGTLDTDREEQLMRYETTTTLAPDAALAAAERFFAGGFGLEVRLRGPQTLGLEGGGGHVA